MIGLHDAPYNKCVAHYWGVGLDHQGQVRTGSELEPGISLSGVLKKILTHENLPF